MPGLKYDRKFGTLSAANPTLQWDQRFSDYWLEVINARPLNPSHLPCPYCKSKHFTLKTAISRPFETAANHLSSLTTELMMPSYAEISTAAIVPGKHANINTFAFSARGNIPFSLAQSASSGEDHSPHTRQSLSLECDTKRPLSTECDMT